MAVPGRAKSEILPSFGIKSPVGARVAPTRLEWALQRARSLSGNDTK